MHQPSNKLSTLWLDSLYNLVECIHISEGSNPQMELLPSTHYISLASLSSTMNPPHPPTYSIWLTKPINDQDSPSPPSKARTTYVGLKSPSVRWPLSAKIPSKNSSKSNMNLQVRRIYLLDQFSVCGCVYNLGDLNWRCSSDQTLCHRFFYCK